jgi:hypothetical protein
MLTLLIGCLVIGQYIAGIITAVAIILHYVANIIMLLKFKYTTMVDAEFSRWILVYRKTKISITVLGGIFSFRLFKLFYAGIFGLDSCMARFDKPDIALMKIQRYLTYYSFIAVYLILTAASFIVIISVSWGYQALITAIEAILLFIIFIILHILERKYDPSPCSDQEYVQIGVKKYGEDITMAGVPLGYNDSLREREEMKNIEYRKLALTSIIKSVQVYNKDGFFSNGTLNS